MSNEIVSFKPENLDPVTMTEFLGSTWRAEEEFSGWKFWYTPEGTEDPRLLMKISRQMVYIGFCLLSDPTLIIRMRSVKNIKLLGGDTTYIPNRIDNKRLFVQTQEGMFSLYTHDLDVLIIGTEGKNRSGSVESSIPFGELIELINRSRDLGSISVN